MSQPRPSKNRSKWNRGSRTWEHLLIVARTPKSVHKVTQVPDRQVIPRAHTPGCQVEASENRLCTSFEHKLVFTFTMSSV